MRISDWSSDVCSSDLVGAAPHFPGCRKMPRFGQVSFIERPSTLTRARSRSTLSLFFALTKGRGGSLRLCELDEQARVPVGQRRADLEWSMTDAPVREGQDTDSLEGTFPQKKPYPRNPHPPPETPHP